MDFAFSYEQQLLREALGGCLADRYSFADRLTAARAEGWRADAWRAFAGELGILGIGVPAEAGGTGGGAIEHMIVAEALGSAVSLEPYVETVVIGAGALVAAGGQRASAVVRSIVAGDSVVAFAWAEPEMRYALSGVGATARREGNGWRLDGFKSAVTAAPLAHHLLVLARTAGERGTDAGLSLFLVNRDVAGLTAHDYPTIDGRRAADLKLDDVRVPADAVLGEEGAAGPLVEALIDRATAALAAEGVGLMRRALADTLAYTRQRQQFRQPLSEFQAIQHRLVDMAVQIELADAAALLAALKAEAPAAERARAVSAAKVTVGKAMRFVGQNAVQLHGGMGMTDELAVGHCLKRMTMIDAEFGTVDRHLDRYARLAQAA